MEKSNKLQKTLKIALFVSLASLIKFDFIVNGFIIAMSVLIMAIFIYCYEDLSALYISCCSGIFSPLFRLLTLGISTQDYSLAAVMAIPDMTYFISYGIFYTLIYKYIVKDSKSINNFPYVVFFCDLMSNIVELFSRCIVKGNFFLDFTIVGALMILIFCRTLLLQMILVAMETYSNLLLRKEHDKEYHRLMRQASIFESELHIMEKNASEIEDIMQKSYSLYKSMGGLDISLDIKNGALEVAKNAHEIKGDYMNIIRVLTDTFIDEFSQGHIGIKDIILIEKSNLQSFIREKKYNIDLHFRIKTDFYIHAHFKMMSLIRNLLLNAAEAIGKKGGAISLDLQEDGEHYILKIWDNGVGISKNDLEDIFLDGYSTKFNEKTGDIQRGMGLTIVKDYVENYFEGTITVQSEKNVYTEFTITLPKQMAGGVAENELLFN